MTRPIDDLITVRDYLRYAASRFSEAGLYFGHGTDNVWDEAVLLVMRSLHLPLENNTLFLDDRLTRDERQRIAERIDRRINERRPVAYLLGEAWFMGLPFQVDERVLVPRSPIAELLEAGLQPWLANQSVERILDLCTGSGCIGIAAATVFPDAEVDLADISEDALAVAQANIQLHELEDRVRVVHSDVLDQVNGVYDVILSNPPYVGLEEYEALPREFLEEPRLGLVSDNEGLDIPLRILREAGAWLNPQGILVLETGATWPLLDEACPRLDMLWLDFEHGGEGVCMVRRDALLDFARS